MVVSTVEYLIPTYILGEAVRMPHWDGGRRDANTRNPVNGTLDLGANSYVRTWPLYGRSAE